jgi:hypothetical protein
MPNRALTSIAGTSPYLLSGMSLFEWLIDDSRANIDGPVDDIITSVEDILRFGGNESETTIESGTRAPTAVRPVFDVLSLDLALVFPEDFDRNSPRLLGRQFFVCRRKPGGDTWYKSALDKYFLTAPYASLLSYPEVQNNKNRFWLISRDLSDSDNDAGPFTRLKVNLLERVIQKTPFDPLPQSGESRGTFIARFKQFANCVFVELDRAYDGCELRDCSLLWIFVSLNNESEKDQGRPFPWGVSLFAVIKPSRKHQRPDQWTANDKLRTNLLRAVEKLYLYLSAEGYKSFQRHREHTEREVFKLTVGQTIAHEFKNLTSDISSLGNSVNNQFSAITKLLNQQYELDAELYHRIQAVAADLSSLSNLSRITNAISLATYRLASHNLRGSLELEKDPGCRLFRAVTMFILDLFRAVRTEWVVEPDDLSESLGIIKQTYGTNNIDKLITRIDFALILFALNEPVRNIRSRDITQNEVIISTDVRGDSLFLCQQTLERGPLFETEKSDAIVRLNKVLMDSEGLSEDFISVSEDILVAKAFDLGNGYFRVHRETQIRVFNIPLMRKG